jgi:sugar (pentulose or hexulose) kinase
MALVGIDLGSSALKGTLLDEERGLCLTRSFAYSEDWIGERPGQLERNAEVYWDAVVTALGGLLAESGLAGQDVAAVCFSVQGETFLVADERFRPLRKAIQGHDVRAGEETQLLRDTFGDEPMYAVSGQPTWEPYWMAPKLLWLRRHEPEVFRRTRRVMMLEDYILQRLTGRFVTDKNLIADSYFYDMQSGGWYPPVMSRLGLDPAMLPEVLDPCTVVGPVTPQAAQAAGLSSRTLIVAGAMDQIANAVGAGNVLPGLVTETTGTALAIGATALGKLADFLPTRLPILFHAVPGVFFLMPWLASGGLTLQWFADNFAQTDQTVARQQGTDVYDLLTAAAAETPAGAAGLVMLPFLLGATCPESDASARGVFCGITPDHRRGHFVRAILEGLAYAIRANLESLGRAGVSVEALCSMGGGSKSALWNQIKADICGVPVTTLAVADTASLGAALMAGVGAGVYTSVEATRACPLIRKKDQFLPQCEHAKTYDAGYRRYRDLYQRLKGAF